MGTFRVIEDMSVTLVSILSDGVSSLFSEPGMPPLSVDVRLETPEKFKDHVTSSIPIVTIFLYRVNVSSEMRNSGRRVLTNGQSTRPLLPLELCYLITPWFKETQIEHRLAGRILQILYDHAELQVGQLIGDFDPTLG